MKYFKKTKKFLLSKKLVDLRNKIVQSYEPFILKETIWLPKNTPFYERIYCIRNDIFDIPICEYCKEKKVTLKRDGGYSYPKFCSLSCTRKYERENIWTQEKINKQTRKRLKTFEKRTSEEKIKTKKKYEKTWEERTQDENDKTKELHRLNWENKTPEQKAIICKNHSKGLLNRPQNEKDKSYKQGIETKRENGTLGLGVGISKSHRNYFGIFIRDYQKNYKKKLILEN